MAEKRMKPGWKVWLGLTRWEGAPQGKVHKYDVAIAKHYLSDFELAQMQRSPPISIWQNFKPCAACPGPWQIGESGFNRVIKQINYGRKPGGDGK